MALAASEQGLAEPIAIKRGHAHEDQYDGCLNHMTGKLRAENGMSEAATK